MMGCSDDEVIEADVLPMDFPLYYSGAFYPVARTRFTRTLHGAGAAHPRGGAVGPTVAMRAIDARNAFIMSSRIQIVYIHISERFW